MVGVQSPKGREKQRVRERNNNITMMKMLGSGRTVTEVKRQVQTCTSQDICKELFI